MSRHDFDAKLTDFTWKQNRLSKEKESLKAQMLGIINKKPKNDKMIETSPTKAERDQTAFGNTTRKDPIIGQINNGHLGDDVLATN